MDRRQWMAAALLGSPVGRFAEVADRFGAGTVVWSGAVRKVVSGCWSPAARRSSACLDWRRMRGSLVLVLVLAPGVIAVVADSSGTHRVVQLDPTGVTGVESARSAEPVRADARPLQFDPAGATTGPQADDDRVLGIARESIVRAYPVTPWTNEGVRWRASRPSGSPGWPSTRTQRF